MTFDWNKKALQLQPYYSQFRVKDRILLTGHSHQAWPNVARDAQLKAFDDAALLVDDKWGKAFEVADKVRKGFLTRMNDSSGEIVLGTNTQELLVRWMSALPLNEKPHLVTTDGEFHSMRRLLDRLGETSIEISKVQTAPVETLIQRLMDATTDKTSAVMCSIVLFKTSEVVPHVAELAEAMRNKAVPLLLDAYHMVNVVPFSVDELKLDDVFIIGGGYKYCQLGESNCFLRVPKNCDWRPLVTGWYAEFASLDQATDSKVGYGKGRWAFEGSTYDTTSHYRAASVFQFFDEQKLDVSTLRQISQAQLAFIREEIEKYEWSSSVTFTDKPLNQLGGFLMIQTEQAGDIVKGLREQNVFTDSRQNNLRLGPAPYITKEQLETAVSKLHKVVMSLN